MKLKKLMRKIESHSYRQKNLDVLAMTDDCIEAFILKCDITDQEKLTQDFQWVNKKLSKHGYTFNLEYKTGDSYVSMLYRGIEKRVKKNGKKK